MKPPTQTALPLPAALSGLGVYPDIAAALRRDEPAPRRRKIAKQERLARRAKRKAAKASRRRSR